MKSALRGHLCERVTSRHAKAVADLLSPEGYIAQRRKFIMLWTILVILLIVALVIFILSRVRGGRGV